jgi:hypothetical protein
MGEVHQEVWYEDDRGVIQRIKVCPDTDWPTALKHIKGARVMTLTRNAQGLLDAELYEPGAFWWFGWDFECPPINEKLREANYKQHLREAESWANLAEGAGSKKGTIVKFTRYEALGLPGAPPGPPKCEMCGCNPWILTTHPINGKRVCLDCKTKGSEGYVACPNTPAHKDGKCVLCRSTPGYVQEA